MRVLINRLTALKQKTGIGHYVAQLLDALAELKPGPDMQLYPGKLEERALRTMRSLRKGGSGGKSRAGGRDGKLGQMMHRLARSLSNWHFRLCYGLRHFDLYHEPNAIPMPGPWPTVATVCDLSVILHPEWHPADRVAYFQKHFPDGLKRSQHILTISEFSREEIIRHFNVPPDQVTVTYPGISPAWRPLPGGIVDAARKRLGLPAQYLLHVSTLEPRKNVLTLMKAYTRLPANLRERCPLVLVGGWGWNVAEMRTFFEETARHQNVIHLGYVPDADLPSLYNGARALVFPTHYEGFGFPPLEMMACGGAVLASTTGAVKEVLTGSKAHLINPDDLGGWTDAMARLIADDEWLEHLRTDAVQTPRAFTWRRCAEGTWGVYQKVAGSRSLAA